LNLTAVGLFVISLFFSILIFSIWLRMALRYFRISTLNPLSQLIHTLSNPLVLPIQKLVPTPKPGQKYDVAACIVLILLEVLKIALISLLVFHAFMPLGSFFLFVLADLIIQFCDLLFYAILIRVIMSFANPNWHSPIADVLRIVTEPSLTLGRKIIPNISGFDFSPFIILMLLKVITLFIHSNLPWRLI
jgi:YggT family protein